MSDLREIEIELDDIKYNRSEGTDMTVLEWDKDIR